MADGSGPHLGQASLNACLPPGSTGEVLSGQYQHVFEGTNTTTGLQQTYGSVVQVGEQRPFGLPGQVGEHMAALRTLAAEQKGDHVPTLTAASVERTLAEGMANFQGLSRRDGVGEIIDRLTVGGDCKMETVITVTQTEKECKDCKEVKPASEFSVNKKSSRLLTYCRPCLSKRQKEYRRLAAEERIQREKQLLEAAKDAERKRQAAIQARLAAGPPAGHKMCKDCGQDKPAAEFNRNVKSTTGLSTYCKPCSRARVKASLARSAEQNPSASKSAPKTRICVTCMKRRPLAEFESGRKKVVPGICNLCAALPKKRQRKIQVPPGAPVTAGVSVQGTGTGEQVAAISANNGSGVTGSAGQYGEKPHTGMFATKADVVTGAGGAVEHFSGAASCTLDMPISSPAVADQVDAGMGAAGVV